MISAKDICFNAGDKHLLENVSATFGAGKMNLIIGPNGAGKSTLIKIISKQLHPHSGTVFYGDENVNKTSTQALSKIRAVLSQNIDLAFPLTVWEVVMMGRYPHFVGKPGPHDEQAVTDAMQYFDVWEMAQRNYLTLSGGEKQRVHFARILAQVWFPIPGKLRYLLLDEPLTFLDIHYQFQFMHQLRSLLKDQDLVVIGVVHDLNLAARFADTILLLHHGKVLASGQKENVLTPDNIERAFQLRPIVHRNESTGSFHLIFE